MPAYIDNRDYCFTVKKNIADNFERYLKARGIDYVRTDLESISFFEAFITTTIYKSIKEWIKSH